MYTDTSLYFYHNNTWNNILNNELFAFSHQNFVYNISNSNENKISINKNFTVFELSDLLTNNIYIELPIVTKNGAYLTIVMGESVSKYINDYNIIMTGQFLSTNGIGPSPAHIKFTKTGQSIKLISVKNKIENIYGYNNNYYQILFNNFTSINISNDSQINQTIEDQLMPHYTHEIKIYNPNSINIIDIKVYQTILQLNTLLNRDIYILLPVVNTFGVEKIITFDKTVQKNINEHKVIVYGKFIDASGLGPAFLNIEFNQSGQSIKVISIKSTSNELYWQILYGHFDNNDSVIIENNTCITQNDPGLLYRTYITSPTIHNTSMNIYYEHLIHNTPNPPYIDLNKPISVLDLNFTLTSDLIITLPNLSIMGNEKLIIIGESVSRFINGHKIILSTICVNQNGDGPHSMYVEFEFSGQFIKLLSCINKNQQLYGYNQNLYKSCMVHLIYFHLMI